MNTLFQINSVVNYGSTGRTAEGIGQVAINNGWNSYVAYGRHEGFSASKLIKIGTNWDINNHVLKTRLFDRHGFGSFFATKRLIEEIEKVQPDVIHLLNIHGYYLNIKVLFNYLKTIEVPVVWTLFDCWAFTGHCTYFDSVGCEKWKIQCFKCPLKKEYPSSSFLDNSESNYLIKKELFRSIPNLKLIVHSQWLQKLVNQSFLKDVPVRTIYNGISLETFFYTEKRDFITRNNLKNFKIILGVTSEWITRKGFSDFIKLSRLIDLNIRILLVGLTNKQIKSLPNNIIGVPRTNNIQELCELYSSADVFVNPTWEDNFPTTNLEALACGLPVITYNTGGSPEAIDLNTGIVVEKGDIKQLANSIAEVLSKGKGFYSEFCIGRAQHLFNKIDRFQEYINFFNEIKNQKKIEL